MLPQRRHYLAAFLLSLSLLMLEITVARILTVALFSHYAFVAISLAMFGLGLQDFVRRVVAIPNKAIDQEQPRQRRERASKRRGQRG